MSTTVTQASRIKCKNSYYDNYADGSTVNWFLDRIDGKELYTMINWKGNNTAINLSDKSLYYIYPGTKMTLKAKYTLLSVKSVDVYIEYSPDNGLTAYFEYSGEGSNDVYTYVGTW